MPKAPLPISEEKRLSYLNSLSILDTPSESDYDEIAQLASIICDVPIALISFIDRDRQWFKSIIGLDLDEAPRELSFCSYALLSPAQPLIVDDPVNDARFKDNVYVTGDAAIRFYAGIPLTLDSGEVMGTLGVIDKKDRKLSATQLTALELLGRNVIALLELRRSKVEKDHLISKLKSSNADLEDFASMVSHDLKEPLRKISYYCEKIGTEETLSSKGKARFDEISNTASRMKAFLNSILEVSRFTSQSNRYSEINVNTVVESVLVDLEHQINEAQATINIQKLPSIEASQVQMKQVFLNLISNALKYARPDKPPIIGIQGYQKKSGWLEYVISDNGLGFNDFEKELAFNPYQRILKENTEGSGLGLATVDKIVKQHNGRVSLLSRAGKGSIFILTLPRLQCDNQEGLSQISHDDEKIIYQYNAPEINAKKILLVEDSKEYQKAITSHLKSLSYSYELVENGKAAFDSYKSSAYDLILMDCEMPIMDGFEASDLIRKWEKKSGKTRTPIVAISLAITEKEKDLYLDAGMTDYIQKPFEKDVLKKVIQKHL